MEYTKDWRGWLIQNIKDLGKFNFCIEIGCFEGLTSNYIVENYLTDSGKLICIDPLSDNYLTENLTEIDIESNMTIFSYFNGQYQRFMENTKKNRNNNKIEFYRDISSNVLPKLFEEYQNMVDFIYIDGDHRSDAVYSDAKNSFKLCKIGGYILFDDYLWDREVYKNNSTKIGVDRFLLEYEGKYEIIKNNYQILIKKTKLQ